MKIKHNISKFCGIRVMLRGQFLALNANIREEEKLQDNNLSFQLKNLKKKGCNKGNRTINQ